VRALSTSDEDEQKLSTTKDVFGRDRHLTDREDMGGVGSFSRENTTLYVGGLTAGAGGHAGAGGGGWEVTERLIREQFGAFGSIKRLYLVRDKGIAFVTFMMRSSAEFAKEAMHGQALGNGAGEQLNLRWANEGQSNLAFYALSVSFVADI
jgi:RNA recognition motif-containing protein